MNRSMLLYFILLCVQWPVPLSSAAPLPDDWHRPHSFDSENLTGQDQSRYDPSKMEGDITNSFYEADEIPTTAFANSETNETLFWPNNTVYYQFTTHHSTRFRAVEQTKVVEAMSIMMHLTGECVKLIERKTEVDYLLFQKGQRAYSDVGRTGGKQIVSLSHGCLKYHGCIQHEIMHALGFWHEQSRMDRDEHVIIEWSNILEANKKQFEKHQGNTYDLPYDYESIMHYGTDAFAKNQEEPTMLPKRKVKLGQNENLSPLDVVKIHRRFKCRVPAAKHFIKKEAKDVCSKELCEKVNPQQQSCEVDPQPRDDSFGVQEIVTSDSKDLAFADEPFPRFSNEQMTSEQCAAQYTPNCKSFGSCPNFKGLEISCGSELVVNEITRITSSISTPPLRAVRAVLFDGPLLKFSHFEPIRKQVISFTLRGCIDETGTSRLLELGFIHLWEFQLGACHYLIIKKEHFKFSRKLKVILFTFSTITTLEFGAFSDLPDLRLLAVENALNRYGDRDIPEIHHEYSYRMQGSCDLAWFRRWWNGNRQLLRKTVQGAIYNIPGSFNNSAYSQEDVFLPIDCSLPFPRNTSAIRFKSNQMTFSLNDKCDK